MKSSWRLTGTIVSVLGIVSGCASSLLPKPAAPPELFVLGDAAPSISLQPNATGPTLIVDAPRAAAGFDTARMAYQRQPDQIEYFARNQWVDTPARMLAPLLVHALESSGAFRAVLGGPTAAAGELRLDTEVVHLQQDFSTTPSRVRLTLRVVLIDNATRRVVASREFDATAPASTDDPRGGVAAADQVVSRVLARIASFCAEATK